MQVVVFDVDGVLIDSWAAYRDVWSRWARRHRLDVERVWAATHGMRPAETVAALSADLDALAEQHALDQLVADAEGQFVAAPGAVELLGALPRRRWGVATSGDAGTTRSRFRRTGLPVPEVLVGGDDVGAGKPDPECFLLAADRLGVLAPEVLVVEDSPAGLTAARDAGMRTLAVATTHPPEQLGAADDVVPTLAAAAGHVREWLSLD